MPLSWLTLLEVAFLSAALVGLAFVAGWPVAVLVGGIVGVVACEAADRRRHALRVARGPVGVPSDRDRPAA